MESKKEYEGIDKELIEKAVNYLIEQEKTAKEQEERKRKKRIIGKIKERLESAKEENLIKLPIEDLGALSRILRAMDYHEPKTPLEKYTALYEMAKRYKWYLLAFAGLIAGIVIAGALI